MLVTHRADVQAGLPLPVALLEELRHDAVGPLAVQGQRLGGVAEVSTVDKVLQDLGAGQEALAGPTASTPAPARPDT